MDVLKPFLWHWFQLKNVSIGMQHGNRKSALKFTEVGDITKEVTKPFQVLYEAGKVSVFLIH